MKASKTDQDNHILEDRQQYWKKVNAAVREISNWPEWKRGGQRSVRASKETSQKKGGEELGKKN